MDRNFEHVFLGFLLILVSFQQTVADTRYECVVNIVASAGPIGFGEADDDFGELPEADEMGGLAAAAAIGARATGSLKCPLGNRGSILVKRVAYGASVLPGTCRSDGMCKEEFDTADNIANKCDGQASCVVDMLQPVFLKCGRMSSYMLIEYECIDSWTSFEICETVSTVARGSSVFITSPGYLTSKSSSATRGTQMCECILQSRDKADLYLDYLQTQLSSDREFCPYEYVMIESKKNINQTGIDKELEVCGRRHAGNRWYQGSVRLTYASGGPMQKRGLLAKFTADNIGNAPRVEIECGPTDASNLKLKDKPPPMAESQAPGVKRTRIPGSGFPWPSVAPRTPFPSVMPTLGLMPALGMRSAFAFGGDDGPMDDASERFLPPFANFPALMPPGLGMPPPRSLPPRRNDRRPPSRPPARRPPTDRLLDFSNWKINLPTKKAAPAPASSKPPSVNRNARPPSLTKGVRRKKIAVSGQPRVPVKEKAPVGPLNARRPATGNKNKPKRKQPINTKAGRVADDQDIATGDGGHGNRKTAGGMVGLVFGGIGAVLILGSVGILAIYNYRKRQRIQREEAEYVYSTTRNVTISGGSSECSSYGKGWQTDVAVSVTDVEESVYATVGEVEACRERCEIPSASDKQETDGPAKEKHTRKPLPTNINDQKNTGIPNEGFVYEGPAACAPVSSARGIHVAVIEVHQTPDDIDDDSKEHLHNSDCLPDCGITSGSKDDDDADSNRCSECRITRPPRRRDTVKGYDNNVSVRRQAKK